MNTNTDLYNEILKDPIFTPDLKEQIVAVQKHEQLTKKFVNKVIRGVHKSAVLQGPPGLGKSYAITRALKTAGMKDGVDYFVAKGHITPLQFFQVLYMFRRKNQVIVLDDCDSLFTDPTGLEMLKAACDSDSKRVTWSSARVPVYNGKPINDFIFNGTIIVATNMSIRTGRGSSRDRAAAAVMSRLTYWPLEWDTRERQYAQIFNMVVNAGYLDSDPNTKLSDDQKVELLTFILSNLDDISSLDLRLPQKLAAEIVEDPNNWTDTAELLIRG